MSSFNVPRGAAALVHIIDSTFRMSDMPTEFLLTPGVNSFDTLAPAGSWSFLIESSTGRKALFDLGVSADPHSCPPLVMKQIEETNVKTTVEKDVAEILDNNGISPSKIESIVWSHWHWDHIGDATTFPTETELVVGPGFLDAYFPGYPTLPDSHIQEKYFKNRNVREMSFSNDDAIKIGDFLALDFFGDGSFYLLDTPGHSVGHLAGLARTTVNPDTFILMGGDLSHHGGELRPSALLPIPNEVNYPSSEGQKVGGAAFRQLNVNRGRKETETFFDPVLADDVEEAVRTIHKAQVPDSRDDVFLVCAHDMGIMGVVDFFPQSANAWKEKGWKQRSHWNFLGDLAAAAAAGDTTLAKE